VIPAADILQPLVDVANGVLKFFHDSVGLSWGGAIIALTICTRAVLIPLTYKSLKGMRALQALQPQLKELKEKYKNDQQRMQQEMMAFYKENKVNPFASCIPLVAQLPVFITLFHVLRNELPADIGCEAGHCGSEASFLFIHDLTAKATGGELIALLILYVGTQLVSGMVMAVTADKSQRMMMFVLPFVFVPFIISFPAGRRLRRRSGASSRAGLGFGVVSEERIWPDEPAERVRELIEGVLDELDLEGEVEIREDDERIEAEVVGDGDFGLLIGKRGQTIDALQLLCFQAAFRGLRDRKRVVIDAAGYRDRRKEVLTARADRAAEQALERNVSVELDPMSAQERRVVHEHLKERSGVETFSEGDEPRRCVVVAPLVSE
jgi:YidC/Oxa1 family membrane protein insertase